MKRILTFFILFFFSFLLDYSHIDLQAFQSKEIKVQVDGAVNNPGLFYLEPYSSLSSLFEQVEFANNADISQFNPSTMIKDGDIVRIPYIESIKKVSINTASIDDLCTLPGIGESSANLIITYRNTVGLFQNIEEIMNIKGIGEAKFNKLKDYICL